MFYALASRTNKRMPPAPLSLYRALLRAHREKLPREMRALGDAYVREEFRKHKAASATFLPAFFREWTAYLELLHTASPQADVGQDLPPSTMAQLSEEQTLQLRSLQAEARRSFDVETSGIDSGDTATKSLR